MNPIQRPSWLACPGVLIILIASACGDTAATCQERSDCPAGHRCADGVCTPELKLDTSPTPADQGVDAPPDQLVWPDSTPVDAQTCQGNQNGKVERSEMLFKVPSSLAYTMGTKITLDLMGSLIGGKTVWDLTAAAPDDKTVVMKVSPVPTWAAAKFPKADYVSLLNQGLGTHGVFAVHQARLELTGAISSASGAGRISYSPGVELLRFPVQVSDAYTTKTTAVGVWNLTPIYNQETYQVTVLGSGAVKLPKLTLDALLVKVKVTQHLYANPLLKSTWVLFMFVSECYGVVARVVTRNDPTSLQAFEAGERWRLTSP